MMEPVDSTEMTPVLGAEERPSGWPTTIGVISLIYALLGMLCAVGVFASSFFTESLMKLGGMDVTMPPVMKISGAISAVLMLIAGVIMLMGAINLMRRKRKGITLLKTWAVMRIIMVLIGVVFSVFNAKAQIEFQRSIEDAQREQMRKSGRSFPLPEKTDQEIWRQAMITSGIMSTLFVAYPVFIGFYMSRRKVIQESQTWA